MKRFFSPANYEKQTKKREVWKRVSATGKRDGVGHDRTGWRELYSNTTRWRSRGGLTGMAWDINERDGRSFIQMERDGVGGQD